MNDQRNSGESFLEESKSELGTKPQTPGVDVHILLATMLGDNVVNFDTRGLWFGAKLQVVKLLMGPGCHGGHDELHRGFWVVIHGVILA